MLESSLVTKFSITKFLCENFPKLKKNFGFKNSQVVNSRLSSQVKKLPKVKRFSTVTYCNSQFSFHPEFNVLNGCKMFSVALLYQTARVWTSRPAKKGGRSVRRKKNSNADVMYICVSMCVM
jgi:hypothetical protein